MPNGANSMRRCRVKVLSADFDVGYAEYMGMVMYTDPDVVLMIRPLDARSSGVMACTTCTGPQKFTSNARRYSVIDAASITPSCGEYPALLIKRFSLAASVPSDRSRCGQHLIWVGHVARHGNDVRHAEPTCSIGRAVPIRREHLPTFALESHDKCLADSSRGARDEGGSHRPTVSPPRPSPMNGKRRRMADVGHPAVSRESNAAWELSSADKRSACLARPSSAKHGSLPGGGVKLPHGL